MITQGADVEIHALRKQGWSVSAIARHVGHDRKTVSAYLNGEREVGVRRKPEL
jgi:transposase